MYHNITFITCLHANFMLAKIQKCMLASALIVLATGLTISTLATNRGKLCMTSDLLKCNGSGANLNNCYLILPSLVFLYCIKCVSHSHLRRLELKIHLMNFGN